MYQYYFIPHDYGLVVVYHLHSIMVQFFRMSVSYEKIVLFRSVRIVTVFFKRKFPFKFSAIFW